METKPIPHLNPVSGWKQIPIKTPLLTKLFGDPLVPIGLFTDYSKYIFVDPIYSGLMQSSPYKQGELAGGLIGAYLRKSIVKRLVRAAKSLKPRHMFLVWDAERPLSVQKALFDYFVQKLVDARGGKAGDYHEEAQKFVSLPSKDPKKPSPHATGAVVDVTIIEFTEQGWMKLQKLNAELDACSSEKDRFRIEMERFHVMRTESKPIPMGTLFDQVSPETNLYFYEDKQDLTKDEKVVRDNRRYLFNTMFEAGFVGYEEEWWHYSCSDQFWAKRLGKSHARVGFAEWNKTCKKHETMMRQVVKGVIRIVEKQNTTRKVQAQHLLYDFVKEVVEVTGDVRETEHPQAVAI